MLATSTHRFATALSHLELRLDPASLGLQGRASNHRIVVAMSGGVDSSVAAALIAREGYETVGMTLQLYDHGTAAAKKGACCAGQDIRDARRVADTVGIAHYVLNYEARFKKAVIDSFAASYLAGETPIPCVLCNQTVKFTDLLQTARDLGASALVTGHYVSSREGAAGWEMYRAADAGRDQSYFLFATTQEQLDFTRFPLGGLQKDQTREIAAALGLPVAAKPDSQDICFVPSGDYARTIEKIHPESRTPGDIVHADGRLIGRHSGIANFTIGQRKGLGIAVGEPLFVIKIEAATGRVVVGPRDLLRINRLRLRSVNWIGGGTLDGLPEAGRSVHVKVRSTQEPQAGLLQADAAGLFVTLAGCDHGVAPGQACVFYNDNSPGARVLGGGFIAAAEAV